MQNDRPSEDPEEKSSAVNDQSSAVADGASNAWTEQLAEIRGNDANRTREQPQNTSSQEESLDFGSSEALYGSGKGADGAGGETKTKGGMDTSVEDFSHWLKSNFSNFDQDSNGKLDRSEVEKQVLEPSHKEREAVYAATLNSVMPLLERTFGNPDRMEGASSESLLHRDSVDKFAEFANDQAKMNEARSEVAVNDVASKFGFIDTDGSSRLSKEELETAINDPNWSLKDRDSFEQVLEKFDALAKTANEREVQPEGNSAVPGEAQRATPELQKEADETVSKRDLDRTGQLRSFQVGAIEQVVNRQSARLAQYLEDTNKGRASEISQGGINDCFLISPMKELANRDPEALSKMITDNKDGSYSVKFPDSDKTYKVTQPTQAELASYSHNEQSAIIEKAYGIRHKDENPEQKPSLISTEHLDYGSSVLAIKALTGSDAQVSDIGNNGEDALKEVKDATEKGEILIAASSQWSAITGIDPRHAFAARFDRESNKIVLENPRPALAGAIVEPVDKYGKAWDGKLDGKFVMEPENFVMSFDYFIRERRAK